MEATLILTPIEIEEFKTFLKYKEIFKVLDAEKALDIKFGKCILTFAFGELQMVVKEEAVFKRM